MLVVKTVLKSGGKYNSEHVLRIKKMLQDNIRQHHKFVCYSDVKIEGVETRPLIHDLPGWWSKIEMFRDVEESFYIDLDMTINGDITDIVFRKSDFCALRNMNPRIGGIGSAIMKWEGDLRHIYHHFMSNPKRIMDAFGNDKMGTPYLGDQGFIYYMSKSEIKPFKIEYFQDVFPNRIKRFDQNSADIQVFYGRNKPWKHG